MPDRDDNYPVDKPHTPGVGNPEWLHSVLQHREIQRSIVADYNRRQIREKAPPSLLTLGPIDRYPD